jgi:beta-glucosidase
VYYSEGLLVGYRWYDAMHETPLFPFGYGLSYTSFRISNLSVSQSRGRIVATVTVTNTGSRAGADVAQLYVASPASAKEPPRQLKAYTKVSLGAGESRTVRMTVDVASLASWDNPSTGWTVHKGTYRVSVGDSSRHLPTQADITIG